MLVSACSGDKPGFRPEDAVNLPMPTSVEPRPFTPELEPSGKWDFFIVPNRGRVVAIVDAGTGPVAVIAATGWKDPVTRNMLRLYVPEGDGWDPITDWVGPSHPAGADSDEGVRWTSASVVDGSIVVTARESGPNGLPISVAFDPASGSHTVGISIESGDEKARVNRTMSGGDSLMAISWSRRIAVSTLHNAAGWRDATPPGGWPKGTARLAYLTYADGIWAIGARRRQGDIATDFVMTSRDGLAWQGTDFGDSGDGGIHSLEELANDGSTILAIGRDGADRLVTQTSSDGTTWSAPVPADSRTFGDSARFTRVVSHPEGTFVGGSAGFNTDQRHCYVAGRACGVGLRMVWIAQDGDWRPILTPPDLARTAVALINGVLYIGGEHRGKQSTTSHWRITTWIPDEPGSIPIVRLPADELPEFDAPAIGHDGVLNPGVTYAWVGCEGCAQFNGYIWHVASVTDNAAEILGESGAIGSRHYSCGALPGQPAIYGTVELVSPWRIEWSIPGYGPIAYLRAGDEFSSDIGCAL
jgi:hypothetical protein